MEKRSGRAESAGPIHVVHFYDDEESFLNQWRDSIGMALSCGSSAILIGTQEHNAVLSRKLAECSVDTRTAARDGRYQVFDAEEVLLGFYRYGVFDERRFYSMADPIFRRALAASQEGILAVGEMVNLLAVRGEIGAAVELEQFWNRLGQSYSFTLQCAYSIAGFSHSERGLWVPDICSQHTHAFFANSK